MRIRAHPLDTDVPYFPFRIWPDSDRQHYWTANHLVDEPLRLNRQAAEVLRLADGETPLSGLISRLEERYPDAGGREEIRGSVLDLLARLATHELIWWREVPLEQVPVGPPGNIFWEITAACNLGCLHCVVGAGAKLEGELSTERCLELAQEMAQAGVGSVTFSGGEPLIHPDFKLLVERVRELGMPVQLSTNGTLVSAEIAHWLKQLDVEIQVSLDGSTPEIHNRLRPGRDAYRRAVAGIQALVSAGHPITIGTVVSTLNLADVPAMIELAQDLGAARFRAIPFVPRGRGQAHAQIEISAHEMKQLTRYLHDLRGTVGIELSSLEFEKMLEGTPCAGPLDLDRGLGCSGAVAYATITPTGEMLPCHFFEGIRADSVADTPFAEVWVRSRFLNYFRHLRVGDLHGACRECGWLMRCGGSCRAVNFSKGDLFGGNAHCWIAREWEAVEEGR